MFKLVIQDDEGKTTIVPLIRDEITIGRKEGNTIRLTERNVSRRHARILRNNGEVHIEDLGSYNGIRVNNARIAERVSLRVSDQGQIGDYKLYLKAEGVEQADDARTMPIERVEQQAQQQLATDAMNASGAHGTAPLAIHQAPTAPQVVGAPNRTLVAISDTDPAGRSVGPVTAAAVAALTATGGYGKLVVLSSNFAGKEWELSRPQMIVGRTDENDIIINHRSISRNHAKLVREPETGRYTISDLQSSNGVRVNGQDYGKVELRRGDVVDLGHVRLRFVDAGEDFVFARDAVITDVPDAGGKRSTVVALIAAIAVVVAGIVVYTMRSTGDKPSGSNIAVPTGSVTIDANGDVVATHPTTGPELTAPADAAATNPTVAVSPPDDKKAKRDECSELVTKHEWQQLADCAAELDKLGDKPRAAELRTQALDEQRNSMLSIDLQKSISEGKLREAQRQLRELGVNSVYYKHLSDQFDARDKADSDAVRAKAMLHAGRNDCASLKKLVTQVRETGTDRAIREVAAVKCVDKVAVEAGRPLNGKNPVPPGPGSGSAQPTGPAPVKPCDQIDADNLVEQAKNQFQSGFASSALKLMGNALACKQSVTWFRLAATYACAAHDAPLAKAYFGKVSPEYQPGIEQKCQGEGITLRPQPQ